MVFVKVGRIGLYEGRLMAVVDGLPSPFFINGTEILTPKHGVPVGRVQRSKSGRAINLHLDSRLFTVPVRSVYRVVRRRQDQAPVFEVVDDRPTPRPVRPVESVNLKF